MKFFLNPADKAKFQRTNKLLQGFPLVVEAEIRRQGKKSVREVKRDAPVDTGLLRRSVSIKERALLLIRQFIITSEAIAEDGTDYAPIQEYGGRFTAPQPYF